MQYLASSSTECHAANCASLASTQYWTTPCGGTSAGTSAACPPSSAPCLSGYYISNPAITCGPASPWPCARCRYEGSPGSWYNETTNCTKFRDVQLSPCPANYYCPGGTTPPQPCPTGMLTTVGAASADECYCPIGKRIAIDSTTHAMTCELLVCNDTSTIPFIPGRFLVSSSYIHQDPTTKISSCILCGAGAVAVGTTFERESCSCSTNQYPFASGTGVVCVPCPDSSSFCSASPTAAMYASCPRNACSNPLPPFAVASPSYPYYTCNSGFTITPAPSKGLVALPPYLSGSSLYATAHIWSRPYAPLPFSTCNPGTIELAEVPAAVYGLPVASP